MSREAAYLDVISGRRRGPIAALARIGLATGTPFYAAAIEVRNRLFDWGVLRSHSAGLPVISVGNITTGGTGKTPVVAAVVHELHRLGVVPGIASRGYRAVDAGGNDEKRVLDLLCPGTPHHQNRDRVTAARALISDRVDVAVLDDGFQHRRLRRDLDIVLIDATNPWGYGSLLPRGLLREPPRSLSRAGLIVVTRANLIAHAELERLIETIQKHSRAPIVTSRFIAHSLRDRHGQQHALELWRGRRVLGFCGIGNPEAFQRTLQEAGLELASHHVTPFPDHHHFTSGDVTELVTQAEALQATALACTLKDLVKLPLIDSPLPILALEIAFDIVDGREAWTRAISDAVRR